YDGFLRLTLHIDCRIYLYEVLFGYFAEFFDNHSDRVWNLLMSEVKNLLSNQLCDNKAFRLVCDVISGLILRPFRQKRKDLRQNVPCTLPFQGGNRNHSLKIKPLPITLDQGQQFAFISQRIDLVYHEYCGRMNPAKVVQYVLICRPV